MKFFSKRFAWRASVVALAVLIVLFPLFYLFGHYDDYGVVLRKAAYFGDVQTVQTILRKHPDVINSFRVNRRVLSSNSGGTFLQVSLTKLQGLWRAFFRTQFDVWDEAEYCALDLAVRGNQPEIVSILLDNKADVTHLNASHYAALHQAVQKGDVEVVKHFLNHNVDLEIKDISGGTPLCWAVLCQQKTIAELLIAHGANINGGDMPPLHWAVEMKSKPMAELLIQNGAKINLEDKWQRTPLSLALQKKADALEAFLREQGARD